MEFWNRTILSVCAAGLGVALAGCEPSGQSAADDEKEPHFVLGQNRVNAMDYDGAVEAFEQSLEANPHSAQAHYQLAMLFGEKKNDPAAAIYHYQKYLDFDPKAPNSEIVKQHITTCKQQLAADVLQLPSSSTVQQQFKQLMDTNRVLQKQLENYRQQLATMKTNLPPTQNNISPHPLAPAIPQPPPANPKPPVAKPRTHIIAAGETPAAIARKYGVNLNALLAANPGLDPKKLRVGQPINLPPP
jgi:LysM repeat protein